MAEEQQLFISLKVKGSIEKLPISMCDTKTSLLTKLKSVCPEIANKPDESIEKIKNQLKAITEENIKLDMKQRIERLIDIIFNEEYARTQYDMTEITSKSRTKTCFSEIIAPMKKSKTISTQTEIPSEKNYQKNCKALHMSNFQTKNIELTKNKPFQRRNQKQNGQNGSNQKSNAAKKKKLGNPDIIKACETILKKNTVQNEMKAMAKQFLKEKGLIQQEKPPIRPMKKVIKTEASEPQKKINPEGSCLNPIFKERKRTEISRQTYLISQPSQKYTLRNHNALSRYQYLNSSIDQLKNTYEEKALNSEASKSVGPKKYKYLND